MAVSFVGVPGTGTGPDGNTFDFQNPDIWDPNEGAGEVTPPGPDNIWFAENYTEDVFVVLSDARTGGEALGDYNNNGITDAADYTVWRNSLNSATALPNDNSLGTPVGSAHYDLWRSNYGSAGLPMMGTFSYGGEDEGGAAGDLNKNFTLVLNNNVTLTGTSTPGGALGQDRARIARGNFFTGTETTTEDFPWGILRHQAGTLQYESSITSGASLELSRDKSDSAGAIYEISGNAVLNLADDVLFASNDSDNGTDTTPGAIFRVRGSNASIQIGDDYLQDGRKGLWGHNNDVDANNTFGVTEIGLGKYITEFVLDENGVSPINVTDQFQLGRGEDINGNYETAYAFMRLKLSEPTTAGSDDVTAGTDGDVIVLANYGRITSAFDDQEISGEILEGRWFDPDRSGPSASGSGILPHDPLYDGEIVTAEYAGATYEWQINYYEGSTAPHPTLMNSAVLSNLMITGTPGDLLMDGTLGPEDRQALVDAIANPPTIEIATAQNLFDLNADELVNNADLALFDTHFSVSGIGSAMLVPEPASISLVALVGLGLCCRRRRR